MKIAFVDEDLSPRTGSRRFTFEVRRELMKRGHEVNLFTTRLNKDSCFKEFLSLPVKVFSQEYATNRSLGRRTLSKLTRMLPKHDKGTFDVVKGWNYWLSQVNLVMEMSKEIADMNCDVVMMHYHGEHWLLPYFYYLNKPLGIVYLNVARRLRRPWGLPFHQLQELPFRRVVEDKALLLPPIGRWEKLSLRRIRQLITPSRYLLEQVERQGMLGQRKGGVAPLGINHSEFYPTEEEEGFALYVGRIHPHKSLELLIAAVKGTTPDVSLLIAGDLPKGYLWYKEKLVRMAEKLNVVDRVKIIESPSDLEVVRLMQRCTVFLFPSTVDTFGLVVLEVMACGKPVIACNRGGVPEVIGNAGFLLEPNPEEWRKTINLLFKDSKLRRQIQEKSLEQSKCFSWKRTTDKLLSSFNQFTNLA